MRFLLHAFLVAMVVLLHGAGARAQPPAVLYSSESPVTTPRTPEEELAFLQKDVAGLRAQLAAAQAADQKDEDLKKRVELLQKQIETQQKMIELLVDHVKKQPLAGSPVEKLQTQAATLEARSRQAAQRDQELTQAVDNLTEHLDAEERNGPRLPATLKELFLPSRTNETPLSVYGLLIANYELFPRERGEGRFLFDGLDTFFLLSLNDRFFLESEIDFKLDGLEVVYGQLDWILSDWLTLVVGRYLAPIGFFNERLHPEWINKLPDFPLMNRVVSPSDFSLNGVQLRGATYLCCSPVKMEYSLYVANGVRLPVENNLTALADLGGFVESTKDVNDAIAWGSRVGFWVPEWGVNVGFSTFFNRPYGHDNGPDYNLWGIDAGYHKGNWDVRFEFADTFQRTPVPPPAEGEQTASGDEGEPAQPTSLHIRRRGFYAQVAYRPYDACNRCLQNTEFVFRYSRARFRGIDPFALDLAAFRSPVDAPVDRDQYTFGINYYFYPSLALKFAYEINQEHGIDLKDNVFLAQLAWGF
jgi:hypothetical protein